MSINDLLGLHNADCLEFLSKIPDDSVDLIAVDPPYFRVVAAEWDRQWKTKDDFISWLRSVMVEYRRVLKPTGSVYLFCGPYLAAETELLLGEYFKVLNHIVWRKNVGRWLGCKKESLTKYFPQSERIIFAESAKPVPAEKRPFFYESLRKYLDETVRVRAGFTSKEVDLATGTQMSGHWFGRSQWAIPSEKNYAVLQDLAPELKPYSELRGEYDEIRGRCGSGPAGPRRAFRVTKDVPYTDVWDFNVVNHYPGKHPCEKPSDLMEHILLASSNVGDVVLDTFSGSGSTAIAAGRLGRRFIGCEIGRDEFIQARDRIAGAASEGD